MDIETVKATYENQLMALPNVVAVGTGEHQGKAVIKVFVSQKKPLSELQTRDVIPEELDGFEIRVEEIGTIRAESGQ